MLHIDIDTTLSSMSLNKVNQLIIYHKYLKKNGFWRLDKQISLIQKITKRIQNLILENDTDGFDFMMQVIDIYWKSDLLEEDKLVEARYNPITYFLVVNDKDVYDKPLTGSYISFLLEIGDDRINKDVFHEFKDVCDSRYINIGIDKRRN